MKLFLFTLLVICGSSSQAFARDDHKLIACEACRAPNMKPPHGGTIEITDNHHLIELVAQEEQIKIYVYEKGLKPIPVKNITINGDITLPKKDAASALSFVSHDDHHSAAISLDSKVHRYTLNVQLQINGSKEQVQFIVER